jgi:uncharacterized protein involved in cysteine biosynthesis
MIIMIMIIIMIIRDYIQYAIMKERIWKEYYRRERMVLESKLNTVSRFEAIKTLAIPVV